MDVKFSEVEGQKFAVTEGLNVTIVESKNSSARKVSGDAQLFCRNGIKLNISSGSEQRMRWLVGTLNGVAVYMIRDALGNLNVVISDEDLYP